MPEANPGVTDPGTTPNPSAATPTPEVNPTPAPEPSAPPPTPDPASAAAAPEIDPATGQPVPPAFNPDWKFKVKDKEYEIDEFLRGSVKDEESYKKLKRLYERSHGLDEVLQSRDQLKAQFEEVQPTLKEYKQIVKSLNEISHYYNNGDLDSFFAKLQIPYEVLANYVREKSAQAQLPPQVQQQLERARQASQDAYNYQQRLMELQESQQQIEIQGRIQYLESVISSKAGDVATKFNEAQGGNPEAFRNFVIYRAQQLTRELGRPATAEEAVERAKEDLARLMGTQSAPQPTPNQPGAVGATPPVIPNVKAGAQSPVRTPPKSLDDLKKIAQTL